MIKYVLLLLCENREICGIHNDAQGNSYPSYVV